ncbi:MAG: histidine--tRNA ligase family protein, partial [Rhizobiales bacterium]|nr:histidine--tRNA ligase family protein [Hyphomicrobiales bacterium]
MSKKNKPARVKARLPRGFIDRNAADLRAVNEMTAKISDVFERYGFDAIETPMFEYTDALGKFLPDADRPNEGVFSLTDDDDQWMSLRYDLTAPLARHVAENINKIQLPYRTYRAGYVFRNEKPGPGRFRQFMQMDADSIGAPGVQADAEMCMMLADVMEALGIKRGDYVVRVNNRKVLDGMMDSIGVTDETQKLSILRAIDKTDKFGLEGVKLLLGKGRKDESGDFTTGAGLANVQIDRLLEFLSLLVMAKEQADSHPISKITAI